MKVYLAELYWDYEGETTIGIYSTQEKAREAIEEYRTKERVNDGWDRISEWTVDESPV